MGLREMMKEIVESKLSESELMELGDEAYENNSGVYGIIRAFFNSVKSMEK